MQYVLTSYRVVVYTPRSLVCVRERVYNMANDKAKKKVPSALKRDRQSERNRLRNKAFRSQVNTVIKEFRSCEAAKAPTCLSAIYSIMDKGVKKGVFKKNKADRFKSRMTKRLAAKV